MIRDIVNSFKNVFFWNPKNIDFLSVLKCTMLFNLLFFFQQFRIGVYPLICFQIIIAIIFIKYCSFKSWWRQTIYCRIVLAFLFIWSLFIIFNCNYNWDWFPHLCFKPYNYICLLFPFILVKYITFHNFEKLLRFSYDTVKVSLLFLIVCFPLMSRNWSGDDDARGESMQLFEVINTYIDGALLFLLFFINRFNSKEKKIIYCTLIVTLFCSAYFGRRGVLLSYVLALVFSVIITLLTSNIKYKIQYIFALIIVLICSYYVVFHFASDYFSFIIGRIFDDTRSGVNDDVMEQVFNSDKMLIGRGFMGTYYNTYYGYRDGIETGYLQLILKGGLIYLILMSIYFIPAIFLGIFKSRNISIKICALYLILFVIIFNVASSNISFSLRYIIAIFCTNMIYNNHCRRLKNNDVNNIIKSN